MSYFFVHFTSPDRYNQIQNDQVLKASTSKMPKYDAFLTLHPELKVVWFTSHCIHDVPPITTVYPYGSNSNVSYGLKIPASRLFPANEEMCLFWLTSTEDPKSKYWHENLLWMSQKDVDEKGIYEKIWLYNRDYRTDDDEKVYEIGFEDEYDSNGDLIDNFFNENVSNAIALREKKVYQMYKIIRDRWGQIMFKVRIPWKCDAKTLAIKDDRKSYYGGKEIMWNIAIMPHKDLLTNSESNNSESESNHSVPSNSDSERGIPLHLFENGAPLQAKNISYKGYGKGSKGKGYGKNSNRSRPGPY